MKKSTYQTVHSSMSFCSKCGDAVTYLHSASSTLQKKPEFFICWKCREVAQVGIGEVMPLHTLYTSTGNPQITEAVQYALEKTYSSRNFGGPHRWNGRFLRFVGKLMSDFADYKVGKARMQLNEEERHS